MSLNDSFEFEYDLLDEYDPLAFVEEENKDGEEEEEEIIVTAVGQLDEPEEVVEEEPDIPAEEKLESLLKRMRPHRKIFLGTMQFCLEPQPIDAVNEHIEELKRWNKSVYSPADITRLLETNGGLVRITEDSDSDEDDDEVITIIEEKEPEIVEIDGIEYWKPAVPTQIMWLTTEAGKNVMGADDPLARCRDLFAEEPQFLTIYKRMLKACDVDGGVNKKYLDKLVDNDPLVQKPKRYAMRFVERLERCDALEWRGKWCITEIGKLAMEDLADVVDSYGDGLYEIVAAELEAALNYEEPEL